MFVQYEKDRGGISCLIILDYLVVGIQDGVVELLIVSIHLEGMFFPTPAFYGDEVEILVAEFSLQFFQERNGGQAGATAYSGEVDQ